jgi:predicted RNase H-like HicB family nuclease
VLISEKAIRRYGSEMREKLLIKQKPEKEIKTYIFSVIIEPDEDRWFAYCPILENRGAATWGYTKEEAIKNIREVMEMTVESMVEHGESIPEEPETQVFSDARIAITL